MSKCCNDTKKCCKKRQPKEVSGIKATGSFVVVEMLSAEESYNTVLTLTPQTKAPPQGFVVSIGPALDQKVWGIKEGDRVLLQGTCVPIPGRKEGERELNIVQAHDVKCVLLENTPAETNE